MAPTLMASIHTAESQPFSEDDFLCHAVVGFVRRERPVWLENFGIILPVKSSRVRSAQRAGVITVCTEERLSLAFEKAAELVSFHRERYPDIVESKELARAVLALKGQNLPSVAEERITARSLSMAIKSVRDECVKTGISRRFISLGMFIACHNRQGDSFQDWFGGADIFVDKPLREVLSQSSVKTFPQAELETAWEPFEAAFGPALATSSLMSLPRVPGARVSESESESVPVSVSGTGSGTGGDKGPQTPVAEVRAAVFRAPAQSVGTVRFIYCTDGFRFLKTTSLADSNSAGALSTEAHQQDRVNKEQLNKDHRYEITFQLEVPYEEEIQGLTPHSTASDEPTSSAASPRAQAPQLQAPQWPFELLSLVGPALSIADSERSWFGIWDGCADLFTQAVGTRRLKSSAGKPSGLLAVRPSTLASEQADSSGAFLFVNLLALMQDEISFAAAVGPARLLSILRHRNRHEISRIDRASVVLRTQHEVPGSIQNQIEKDYRSDVTRSEISEGSEGSHTENRDSASNNGSSEAASVESNNQVSSTEPANAAEAERAISSATESVSSASSTVSSAVSSAGSRKHPSDSQAEHL